MLNEKRIQECRFLLLNAKGNILNRVMTLSRSLRSEPQVRDEADLLADQLNETQALSHISRLRTQLLEIELALAKIERGQYGICEETAEWIEEKRLLSIPWTRFSTEGAEIHERMTQAVRF